eukprot:TRINITY_DN738_c0_g1_i1.p1 TRINITY_DN738_c0_g1~~TRINITY_DN738_c0_g1_i1.p1  ORF type:complete len:851 (-),score=40.70 TRINITY_DN738_c0_g1_i1:4257-6809(-)
MNVTDIDDKIILRAKEQGKDPFEIARRWEKSFFTDIEALGVKMPDCIVRVSEYIPEILEFIERIMKRGYAYVSNGSVYFDIQAFKGSNKHVYPKLDPGSAMDSTKVEQKDNQKQFLEGEGALISIKNEKKNPFDFALWKKSKNGEPHWTSPWGDGRPGWHIECSAMASSFFKTCPIDIHSGGVDLKFPHHDNEMAQSEAYYDCKNVSFQAVQQADQWINYFIHSGHLEIKGHKMSKSLKNFITIKEVLKSYTGQQVRVMVLMHKWGATFNYSDQAMPEAVELERQIYEFFLNVKAKTRDPFLDKSQKWDHADRALYEIFNKKSEAIHNSLCDSFDTPTAMRTLFEIITSTNTYLKTANVVKKTLVDKVAGYVSFVLSSFGVFPSTSATLSQGVVQQQDLEKTITPYINALCQFRDEVKEKAKEGPGKVFEVCDKMRDEVLPELGIRVEDFALGKPSQWKLEDKDKLKAYIKQRIEEKRKKMELKQIEDQRKRYSPEEYFKQQQQYSKFDEKGVPTHDSAGRKLNPQILKRLRKEYRVQQRLYTKWLEENKANQQTLCFHTIHIDKCSIPQHNIIKKVMSRQRLARIGIEGSPFRGDLFSFFEIALPNVGYFVVQGIIRIWCAQQRLDGQQHRSHQQRRTPLILQNIQTNPTQTINVRVIDLRPEQYLWRNHRIFFRQVKLKMEHSTFERSAGRTSYLYFEVPEIVGVRLGIYANYCLSLELLDFLVVQAINDDTFWMRGVIPVFILNYYSFICYGPFYCSRKLVVLMVMCVFICQDSNIIVKTSYFMCDLITSKIDGIGFFLSSLIQVPWVVDIILIQVGRISHKCFILLNTSSIFCYQPCHHHKKYLLK